ncbi:hypothetical protein TRFO_29148 [Tritrichomonas foetus]|uniref:SUN domain-containing protein n=1 Tax=Tritrichomonas foetus TaxID=1144522 RepID=A0A1J4JWV4_9EUKA|nr:hypothetical protein TRFO_29148 [Tritrichomonas foetus]|eukprot:OHT03483.1 hypothetical protein TRFO_29148 [Tritrichomonas foetus]
MLIFFHFLFLIKSIANTDQSDIPAFFHEELKKIDTLEKNLNSTIDLVFELLKKNEEFIDPVKIKEYENQLEILIQQADQVLGISRPYPNSKLYKIPLILKTADYKTPYDGIIDVNYPGYYVIGEHPEFIFSPATQIGNKPHGIILRPLFNHSCEPHILSFDFYSKSHLLSKNQVKYIRRANDEAIPLEGIPDFDELHVLVKSKYGVDRQTCLPHFSVYTLREE